MAGAVLPLSWGRASVLYSVQRFCMLSGGAPFVARLRFMFLLGFPLPHYPFLWPLPLFLFYISISFFYLKFVGSSSSSPTSRDGSVSILISKFYFEFWFLI